MNKTVTINISRIIFHIEEDAYDALSKYLNTIKGFFRNTEGGTEIMADIEARIAELLQGKNSPSKQVIIMTDVQEVIETMGRPEEFADADDQQNANQSRQDFSQANEKIKRRLFRDPDDKAIGGVCSGLASYFDIDTVWVRLAMFLLIFFGGLSLWVYIILWIVMPEARTTADKFAMRGEPANINNIFKSFKEEAEDVKTRMNKYGRDFREQGYGNAVRNNVETGLRTVFSIIGRLIGLILVLIGTVMLFFYVASVMGITFADHSASFAHWRSVIFASPTDYALAVFSFIVLLGIPVVMIVYGGIKLLFRLRYSNRWLNLSLGLLWSIALVIGIYVTAVTFKQFGASSKIKEVTVVQNIGDTIVIKLNPDMTRWKELNFDNDEDVNHYFSRNVGGYVFGEREHELSILGYARLNIVYSEHDSSELVISRVARGLNKREANVNANAIQYTYKQEGNVILLDKYFLVDEQTKFRGQKVNIILKLPEGKIVKLDKSLEHVLDDVDNTTNTWDGDMANRRWKMTERGLECIDCANLQHVDGSSRSGKGNENVTIDANGIQVETAETNIKIDADGINIHTPEKDVKIDSEGPKVKTKKSKTKSEE